MNFALDPIYHDLYLNADGSLAVTGAESLPPLDQRIDCHIRTFVGEYWLDPTIGIDYFGIVFVKNPDLATIKAAFSLAIQKVPGVQSIQSLDIDFDRQNRKLSVTFNVTGVDSLEYFKTSEVVL